jgi:molybdopterin-guanine dinucleotide biosynthesis protein
MVGLEYQAAAPPELGDCMRDVVTALSKFREVQRKYVLQALAQSHKDAADSIRHTEDGASDAVSLAGDEDSHVNRTESKASAGLLSSLKDGSAVLVDSFFPQLTATPYATLSDLEHLTFPS